MWKMWGKKSPIRMTLSMTGERSDQNQNMVCEQRGIPAVWLHCGSYDYNVLQCPSVVV